MIGRLYPSLAPLFSLGLVLAVGCTPVEPGASSVAAATPGAAQAALSAPALAGGPGASSVAGAIPSAAQASASALALADEGRVAAKVGDAEITFADLDEAAAAQLVRMKTQLYEIRKQTLDRLVDSQLRETEAQKRGITVEALIQVEVADKLVEPTDEEAKAYFDQNPPRGGADFEQLMPRIKQFMQRKARQDAELAFNASLREKAGVEVFLEPLRFDVGVAQWTHRTGKADAPIQIVEFSDFQCPYCSRVNPAIDRVKKAYGDKVSVAFRHFPLPMHAEAGKGSEASQCAGQQDKFWEYHDLLFANQRAMKDEDLKGYAAELGLDAAAFSSCLDSSKFAKAVEEDKKAGAAVGVAGTPAFFINGQFLNGARPFEDFKGIIDGELKKKGLL